MKYEKVYINKREKVFEEHYHMLIKEIRRKPANKENFNLKEIVLKETKSFLNTYSFKNLVDFKNQMCSVFITLESVKTNGNMELSKWIYNWIEDHNLMSAEDIFDFNGFNISADEFISEMDMKKHTLSLINNIVITLDQKSNKETFSVEYVANRFLRDKKKSKLLENLASYLHLKHTRTNYILPKYANENINIITYAYDVDSNNFVPVVITDLAKFLADSSIINMVGKTLNDNNGFMFATIDELFTEDDLNGNRFIGFEDVENACPTFRVMHFNCAQTIKRG